MFKTRLLSGILLVIIAFVTIFSGGYVLFGTLLLISLIGMRELYIAMHVHEKSPGFLEGVGYLSAILYYAAAFMDFERYGMMAVLAGLILIMFVYVFCYPRYDAGQVMAAFLVLYM